MSNTEQDPKKQTDQATSADPKKKQGKVADRGGAVSYTHLRAHET